MGQLRIEPGETREISTQEEADTYRIRLSNGRLRLAERRRLAAQGDEIVSGEQVTAQLENNDDLFAFNPTDATVQININPQGLIIANRSTIVQRTAAQNFGNVQARQVTSSSASSFETLPNVDIPDGATMFVEADSNNGGNIRVEDSDGIPVGTEGKTFDVSNMDAVNFFFENSGDKLRAHVEVN